MNTLTMGGPIYSNEGQVENFIEQAQKVGLDFSNDEITPPTDNTLEPLSFSRVDEQRSPV